MTHNIFCGESHAVRHKEYDEHPDGLICLDSMLPGDQSSHRWAGIFLCSGCLGDSEDSNSLLHKGLVPKRGLVLSKQVPSGI